MPEYIKGLIERGNKLYVRKVYRDSAGKKKEIWRKVETQSDGKTLLRGIENEPANFSPVFTNITGLSIPHESLTLVSEKGAAAPSPPGPYRSRRCRIDLTRAG
jgi:hypothetical protein